MIQIFLILTILTTVTLVYTLDYLLISSRNVDHAQNVIAQLILPLWIA